MKTVGQGMAVFILVFCFAYLGGVTFFNMPQAGNEHAKTIVPFILSIVGTIAGFYYGYSLGQKTASPELIKQEIKPLEVPPAPTAADQFIEAAKLNKEKV
jgi:hypothetical protein